MTSLVAVAVVALPWLAAVLVPERASTVAPGTTVAVPAPDEPAFTLAAPAGWTESDVPDGEGRPLVWTRGSDRLAVYTATGVADADSYAARLTRLASVRSGITAEPDGRAAGPDGLAGPRFRVASTTGGTGELVVLGRGDRAVG